MIYSWSQENSSPLKWYFSWVLTLQSSSGLGIYLSLLHVFFSGFHYYMTLLTSIYSAEISAGLPLLWELCLSTTQNGCFVFARRAEQFSCSQRPPHPSKGLQAEQWGAVAPADGNVHSLNTNGFLKASREMSGWSRSSRDSLFLGKEKNPSPCLWRAPSPLRF